MLKKLAPLSVVLVFSFLASMVGCGGSSVDGKIAEYTKGNITKLAMMYKVYSDGHGFEGPPDEATFKEWIQGEELVRRQLNGFKVDVDKFDDYMKSERTGEKFEIRWGVKSFPMAPAYPVAYDPEPVEGIRYVGMAGGATLEVEDDEHFDMLKEGEVPDDLEQEGTETGNKKR